jgi:hypothetical protein
MRLYRAFASKAGDFFRKNLVILISASVLGCDIRKHENDENTGGSTGARDKHRYRYKRIQNITEARGFSRIKKSFARVNLRKRLDM